MFREYASLAPSTNPGIAGDGGLLVADDWLLPELYSMAPSLCLGWFIGVEATGECFPVGVPN